MSERIQQLQLTRLTNIHPSERYQLSPVLTVRNQYVALQHSSSPLHPPLSLIYGFYFKKIQSLPHCLVASEVLPKKQLYSTNERRENDNEALFKVDGASVAYTHH
jgi:hypothetical protein